MIVLIRILGNELPGRDLPGSRLKALQFLLDNEPPLPGCARIWFVNRICDPGLRRAVVDALNARKEPYLEAEFHLDVYRALADDGEKARYLCPVNQARNIAVRCGLGTGCERVLAADGDCIFDRTGWQRVLDAPRSEYTVVPMTRIRHHEYDPAETRVRRDEQEPQVVFSTDARDFYDESIPYPDGEKNDLLFRIGMSREFGRQHVVAAPGRVVVAGRVYHLDTGLPEVEDSVQFRVAYRRGGIDALRASLEARP